MNSATKEKPAIVVAGGCRNPKIEKGSRRVHGTFSLRRLTDKVEITFQGELVQAKYKDPRRKRGSVPWKRGKIKEFSKASRKRLLQLFARLEPKDCAFITLTYPKDYPDAQTAKKHLQAFMKRLKRWHPGCCGVWRLEFQRRGAPHFHIVLMDARYLPKQWVQAWWGQIIGYEKPFTRIEDIKSYAHLRRYVSKYLAKVPDNSEVSPPPGGAGFNTVSYLAVGRFWGYFNKEYLPFAEKLSVEIRPGKGYYNWRRGAKRKWLGLRMSVNAGFSLFVADADRWLEFLYFNLLAEAP